jgi:hypothetical protein
MTKSQRIRGLIDKGMNDGEIRRRLKVSPQLIYIVRKNYKDSQKETKSFKQNPVVKELKVAILALERAIRKVA